ncbi:MAG: hypothetical protein YK1309IOTA_320005 [Marine Group I thaumarchaeote]|nr:MAG: hypothetical protein YK1309IOTA_320005 [Marine Group I thaumarchaeote]
MWSTSTVSAKNKRSITMAKPKINFLFKIGNNLLHKNYNDHGKVECPICNSEIEPYWEPRYDGIRASCTACGTNWAES